MTPRRELVEPNAPLSMRWQCELLGVNRSSLLLFITLIRNPPR